MSRCVITGVGLVTALGQTADETFENIRNGNSGIKPIRRLSTEGCYSVLGAEVNEVTVSNAACTPTYTKLGEVLKYSEYGNNTSTTKNWNGKDHKYYHILGKALDDAINDAHLATKDIRPTDVLLNATCSGDSDMATFRFLDDSYYSEQKDYILNDNITEDILQGLRPTTVYFNNTRATTISTACSSGTVALAYASMLIETSSTDRVIVMGADILSDVHYSGFLALKALDDKPCQPFSSPNGLTLGDGAAAIVLESEETAKERGEEWYCYVAGSALSSEAIHITSPDPTGESQYFTMKEALKNANLTAKDVDFIYTHGTGTPKNDEAESLAIEKLIDGIDKYSSPYVGSSKSAVGHTLGASGLVNVALASKMFQNNTLLPTIGFTGEGINKNINYIGNLETLKEPKVIMCNSFAFGGNDSSIVLSKNAGLIKNDILPTYISVTGWDLYTNTYDSIDDFIRLDIVPNPKCTLPKNSDFMGYGIDVNNLRKMDLYSRIKCVSGIRALEKAGVKVTNENCHRIGILGGSEIGTPTPLDKDNCRNIAEKGNSWGDAVLFPNSVYNAGDGWLSICTGIKGPCITTIDAPSGLEAYCRIATKLFTCDRVDSLLLSYCNLDGDSFTCISIVLQKSKNLPKIRWDEVSDHGPRPNTIIRDIIRKDYGRTRE